MVRIKAFKAIRPKTEFVSDIAALPYDVMDTEEAREVVLKNNKSFLKVDRAEVNFDEEVKVSPYEDKVYSKAKEILDSMIENGSLIQDEKDMLYIYEEHFMDKKQRGLVFCASIDDYIDGSIKKHELTRAEKEIDRIKHVDTCDANTGPIFLTYKKEYDIKNIVDLYCEKNDAIYDFVSDDNVRHVVWKIDDDSVIDKLISRFKKVDSFYIADGHHRTESAVKVGQLRRSSVENYTGEEEFNYFLAVAFPSDELTIIDYNIVVEAQSSFNLQNFIAELKVKFKVEMLGSFRYKPKRPKTFGMCVKGTWYSLEVKSDIYKDKDIVSTLDVSILENEILKPLLEIKDVRTDKRIDFVGGIRGLEELEKRVADGMDMDIAFAIYPTSIDNLIQVADKGLLMPPKSTWFEPKLRSGLFIHKLK